MLIDEQQRAHKDVEYSFTESSHEEQEVLPNELHSETWSHDDESKQPFRGNTKLVFWKKYLPLKYSHGKIEWVDKAQGGEVDEHHYHEQ